MESRVPTFKLDIGAADGDEQLATGGVFAGYATVGEHLADVAGAGTATTPTFSAAVQEILVTVTGIGTARVRFDGAASATVGIPISAGQTGAFDLEKTSFSLFAPTGATVSILGLRR
jgi:hypothetical protein